MAKPRARKTPSNGPAFHVNRPAFRERTGRPDWQARAWPGGQQLTTGVDLSLPRFQAAKACAEAWRRRALGSERPRGPRAEWESPASARSPVRRRRGADGSMSGRTEVPPPPARPAGGLTWPSSIGFVFIRRERAQAPPDLLHTDTPGPDAPRAGQVHSMRCSGHGTDRISSAQRH